MTNAFYETTLIYKQAARMSLVPHQITHSLFREFSFRLQNFISQLGDEIEIADWKRFVRRLKRFRFEQLAAPLGFGNLLIMPPNDLADLAETLRRLRGSSPDFISPAGEIFQILRELIADGGNPMLDELLEILEDVENLPVVIVESRLIKPTEKVFADAGRSEKLFVLSESQLRRNVCFEAIACFGVTRWHSEHIFTAPRAEKIHLLRFDWLRDNLKRNSVFINPAKSVTGSQRENDYKDATEPTENILESSDIIPAVNLTEIAQKFAQRTQKHINANDLRESVEARLFWLEGRRGVFLEEDSRALIIDLKREPPVRKRRVAEIAIGDFVLLRDKGGGDYIVPLANKILGIDAAKLREFQWRWKETLHNLVKEIGAAQTVIRLKNLGARSSNKVNLRNWIAYSERNIDTRYPEDYDALMKLAGLEEHLDECRKNAKLLRSAHQKAGNEIRRMLIRKVAETDLNALEKYGEMTFDLGKSSGRLIARRVVRRAENTVQIEAKQLNRRFRLE